MISKSRTSYFLRINKELIINLENFSPDMDNYGRLNVFTGMFENKEELTKALKMLQLVPENEEVSSIDVVRRKGNKNEGYYFEPIEEGFVYAEILPFLSTSVLKNFFTLNIDNYEVIYDAFDNYLFDVKQNLDIMRKSIDRAKKDLQLAYSDIDKSTIMQKIKNKETAYQRYLKQYHIISTICNFTKQLDDGEFTSNEFRVTHIEMIESFIDMETKYFKDGYTTLNKRGLVKLAKRIVAVIKAHNNIRVPERTNKYNSLLNEFKNILSEFEIKTQVSTNFDDDGVEPDTFMFLEEDDFRSLGKSTYDAESKSLKEASSEMLDSIENEIENLNSRKGIRK